MNSTVCEFGECGSNEEREDQKKRSSVQKFAQIVVFTLKTCSIFHEF